jgi:hypothetical protein
MGRGGSGWLPSSTDLGWETRTRCVWHSTRKGAIMRDEVQRCLQ